MARSIPPAVLLSLPGFLGALALVLIPTSGRAAEPQRPSPPPPRIQYFDSDPQACKPEAIRAAYAAHLLPFADQSPEVLARLKRLQDDITLASLKRCVEKGLLTRPQASELFRGLGLTLPGTPIQPSAAPSASPSTRP